MSESQPRIEEMLQLHGEGRVTFEPWLIDCLQASQDLNWVYERYRRQSDELEMGRRLLKDRSSVCLNCQR